MKRDRPSPDHVRWRGRWIGPLEWSLMFAGKRKRRKGRYLPGWESRHKENRTALNRRERHLTKGELHLEETRHAWDDPADRAAESGLPSSF